MTRSQLERDVRFLKAYALGSTLLLVVLLATAFQTDDRRTRFEEIDVERINVVDADGQRRVVIANFDRSPGIVERGEELTDAGGRPGLIFYNDEETEAGGLVFRGAMDDDGHPVAGASLTLDQYGQDQAVALQYVDDNGTWRSGLGIVDYPRDVTTGDAIRRRREIQSMPQGAEREAAVAQFRETYRSTFRFFAGRNRDDGASVVHLYDGEGKPGIRMRVDTSGTASLEFYGEDGEVVYRLPDDASSERGR